VADVSTILGKNSAVEGFPLVYASSEDCQMDCFTDYGFKECWGCTVFNNASDGKSAGMVLSRFPVSANVV
jgi:hypothetical protein